MVHAFTKPSLDHWSMSRLNPLFLKNKFIHKKILKLVITCYQQLLLSACKLCKQFGPRSGPAICQIWSGSKLCQCGLLMVLLKEFFGKKSGEKISRQKSCKITQYAKSFTGFNIGFPLIMRESNVTVGSQVSVTYPFVRKMTQSNWPISFKAPFSKELLFSD